MALDKEIEEVTAYEVKCFECECPYCEVAVRVADDDGISGTSFNQECTDCDKEFLARCA
ncbi:MULTISPECIES: hypothetical protein [Pseudoalteromonas]|uniref:hypothetical protein n=1 Tax=Pseudoalteromonas TaxID=53246 RepID=UPI0015820BD7|nr:MULTISPECIES: hypothetical protein [Pseudoalteromonas]MDI4652660.1 hypothetical protein [Pseudoalteromonas shioyasakiensis]NUJ38630.1 hypothetical protein [Pseudoalteromonas sp. 0303]